ncbi:DUF6119 family protein [Paraburkholderia sp. BL23I1N1]|uniref:DUF6119 family protein n=1 Tax=Paraburkholderia sp. BL23I1N1 TaxID=1938802 RepID=UPI001C7CB5F5|nr:DUF6119 family protein [Paraburkholderia sp. BL23I1N1]
MRQRIRGAVIRWHQRELQHRVERQARADRQSCEAGSQCFVVAAVYAIATGKDIPVELPFFSKITLKNALLSLQTLGFRVAIARIEVDPVLLNTKKFKTVRPRRRRGSPASAMALV